MPKYNARKVKQHLEESLIAAAAQGPTLDQACQIAQALALLEIADTLDTIKTYTGSILDQLELMRVDLDSIENELDSSGRR